MMEEYLLNTGKYFLDEAKLQTIFPEEIWLLIFNQLSPSSYYHLLCAASPYFHKLLLPLRTSFLFPQVIRHLENNNCFSTEKFALLLTCRAVCRVWKDGVDACFHQTLCDTTAKAADLKRFPFYRDPLNNYQRSLLRLSFETMKMDKFLNFFGDSHFSTDSNPFPSRATYIEICARFEIPDTYLNNLVHVLRIYGHHIWHCFVEIRFQMRHELEQYMLIFHSLLTLLPELQTLRIRIIIVPKDEAIKFFEDFLTTNPLPKLKKLKVLEVEDQNAEPIGSDLIQINSHITKLGLQQAYKRSALFATPPPNLKELHIHKFNKAKDFFRLQKLRVQWPLRKLTIFCHRGIWHVNDVFRLIESKWAGTLTDLCIVYHPTIHCCDTCPLKLPHLQNLKLVICEYICMDFILPMSKSLVSLTVCHNGISPYDKGEGNKCTIKFFLYRENLLKSNIWKHFPKLRKVLYGDGQLSVERSYRRDHWERYNFIKLDSNKADKGALSQPYWV